IANSSSSLSPLSPVSSNAAITERTASITISQDVSLPMQSPLQPTNSEPAPVVAVSVTVGPSAKLPVQSPSGHEMPGGSLVTWPEPVPDVCTESECCPAGGSASSVKFATTSPVEPDSTTHVVDGPL